MILRYWPVTRYMRGAHWQLLQAVLQARPDFQGLA